MQSKSTQKKIGFFCTRILALALIFSASIQFSDAQQNPAKANKLSPAQKAQQRTLALQSNKGMNAGTKTNDAGIISKASTEINSPAATCTTFNFNITNANSPVSSRAFRDGVVKTCAAPGGPCQAGIGGSFFYQIYQWTNPVAQCVTVTYTATSANFSFFTIHNAPPTIGNYCANWVSDPGSSVAPGPPIVFSFNGTAGTTYYFMVTNVGAPPVSGSIQIDAPVCSSTPCAGSPNPGNTTGPASVCPTVPFNLGIQNAQNFAGITYQWEQSTTGTGGPWSNAPGASTSSVYTTNITVATAYRCKVTCTNSSQTTYSNPINVTINPPSSCYCAGGATDQIDEKISRVRYNTIDNSSTSQAGYENFTNISTTVIQGSTQDITVNISNFFTGDLVKVWIDFNQNGNWTDPGELVVNTTSTTANPAIAPIFIPLTSTIGPTRMRVRMYWSPADANPGPCGNTAYGQVEDYTVNIQPCIQGVFNTHPLDRNINCGDATTFSVATTGSLLTYGWEYKTSAASTTWFNVTNGGIYSGATTNTLTLTNVPQSYNGYVYRATIIGPCTAIDFSNPATLAVGPYVVTFNPPTSSPVTICTGTLQQISISNLVSVATTAVFSSGAISIPIPDANVAGINHTIPVSGISGIISDISVRFSIPAHTWPGDMTMALRGPGGQILNLDYFISNTGAGPGAGMVNTNFSSNAPLTAKLSTSTAPYTGTFTPDAQLTATANGPIGPTGFQTPAVANFQGLVNFSNGATANGNWTLAIYDGFGGDIGSLTNWQISITYAAPVFATGTWTGPAGTMWATAAGSGGAPYVTGTQASSIWVNPTASTNSYSVTVSTATPCTSTGTVVVNVTNPVTIAASGQPVNKTVCVGSNTSFSVTAGGGPLTYQWQQSTDGGITWSNISGATGTTLNLTAVTQLMNNYLYRCNVTASPCGTVTSSVARLNVNQLPVVTLTSTGISLVPGRIVTLNGNSNPAPNATPNWVWTLNGNPVAGTTSSITANIDQQGSYQVSVTDINGCRNSSNIITIGSQPSDYLWIYPNPNTGKFHVRLYYNRVQGERRIVSIYNMLGARVVQQSYDFDSNTPHYADLTFDLSNLSAGTYTVKVVDKHDQLIKSGLVVKQ